MDARKAERKRLALEKVAALREGVEAGPSANKSDELAVREAKRITSPVKKTVEEQVVVLQQEVREEAPKTQVGEGSTKKAGAAELQKGKKRKLDDSLGSPTDVKRWSKDWDVSADLYTRGKEIGAIMENLPEEDWEEEAKKMKIWGERLISQSGTITYLKSRIKALTADLCERNKEVVLMQNVVKEADAQKKVLGERLEEEKKSHGELKEKYAKLEEDVKEKDAANALLNEEAKSLNEIVANLSKDVEKYQTLFAKEAEGTFKNVMSQVRFFNPEAKLENVHYLHFLHGGQLVRVNEETEAIEPVPLVVEEESSANKVPENAEAAQETEPQAVRGDEPQAVGDEGLLIQTV